MLRHDVDQVTLSDGLVTFSRQRVRARTPRADLDVVTVDARALAVALELAGGDHGLLRFDPSDGSVLVANHSRVIPQ